MNIYKCVNKSIPHGYQHAYLLSGECDFDICIEIAFAKDVGLSVIGMGNHVKHCNPYVEVSCQLWDGKKIIKTTKSLEDTHTPHWNETICIKCTIDDLLQRNKILKKAGYPLNCMKLQLKVYHKSDKGGLIFLGQTPNIEVTKVNEETNFRTKRKTKFDHHEIANETKIKTKKEDPSDKEVVDEKDNCFREYIVLPVEEALSRVDKERSRRKAYKLIGNSPSDRKWYGHIHYVCSVKPRIKNWREVSRQPLKEIEFLEKKMNKSYLTLHESETSKGFLQIHEIQDKMRVQKEEVSRTLNLIKVFQGKVSYQRTLVCDTRKKLNRKMIVHEQIKHEIQKLESVIQNHEKQFNSAKSRSKKLSKYEEVSTLKVLAKRREKLEKLKEDIKVKIERKRSVEMDYERLEGKIVSHNAVVSAGEATLKALEASLECFIAVGVSLNSHKGSIEATLWNMCPPQQKAPPPPPDSFQKSQEKHTETYLREAILCRTAPIPLDEFGNVKFTKQTSQQGRKTFTDGHGSNEKKKEINGLQSDDELWNTESLLAKREAFLSWYNENDYRKDNEEDHTNDGEKKNDNGETENGEENHNSSFSLYQQVQLHSSKYFEPVKMTPAYLSPGKVRATNALVTDPTMKNLSNEITDQFLHELDTAPETLQQVRGVFASFDEDGDGLLNLSQLKSALQALGCNVTEDLLNHFIMVSPSKNQINLSSFCYVFTKMQGKMGTAARDILELFKYLGSCNNLKDSWQKEKEAAKKRRKIEALKMLKKSMKDHDDNFSYHLKEEGSIDNTTIDSTLENLDAQYIETTIALTHAKDDIPDKVPRKLMRHILTEVSVDSKLTENEANDFFTYCDALMKSPYHGKDEEKEAEEIDLNFLLGLLTVISQ
eukprot:g6465.t1